MRTLILIACTLLISLSAVRAQIDKNTGANEQIHVKLKDGAQPDIYVDGKKFNFPMEILDKNKIASVNVLKGEKAWEEYKAKNGVILITTKASVSEKGLPVEKELNNMAHGSPRVIIDGKTSNQAALKKLSPEEIERIDVIKGEQALQEHNAPHGIIIVTTKKDE